MILQVEITMQPGEDRHEALDWATEAVRRAYRRETGSRRQVSVWRWNEDGYSPSGGYSLNRGSVTGLRDRKTGSSPVLAEAICTLRSVKDA